MDAGRPPASRRHRCADHRRHRLGGRPRRVITEERTREEDHLPSADDAGVGHPDPELTVGLPPGSPRRPAWTRWRMLWRPIARRASIRWRTASRSRRCGSSENLLRARRKGPTSSARQYDGRRLDGRHGVPEGLGGMHALCHPVGALSTHHGLTNAVVMPYVLAYNRHQSSANRLGWRFRAISICPAKAPRVSSRGCSSCARRSASRTRLKEIGVDEGHDHREPAPMAEHMRSLHRRPTRGRSRSRTSGACSGARWQASCPTVLDDPRGSASQSVDRPSRGR